jgi:nucleotide-binding universal stress UspA family protein
MFKRILVPTDGSELSLKAARQAVALAQKTGSQIVALHVAPPYTFRAYEDYMPPDFVRPAEYEAQVKKTAERYLEAVRKIAAESAVPFEQHYTTRSVAAEAIVQAAEEYSCDSIVMGSHGRGAVGALLLGSETLKVLTAAKVPVLVVR